MRRHRPLSMLVALALALSPAAPAGAFSPVDTFPIPTANPQARSITRGPDGNLWFGEADEISAKRIGRITPAGTVTEFPVATGVTGVTAGPDGNVWFALDVLGRIGRITPTGVVTEFPGPPGTHPHGITLGPDGNFWYTNFTGGLGVGRMTPTGSYLNFAVGGSPFHITTGGDGNLWFTEFSGNRLGRITPGGMLTMFVLAGGSQPYGITAGPAGSIWFTLFGTNRIGRWTVGGITEFTIPVAGSGPTDIALGPDGNLWFTMSNVGRIGVITTGGTFLADFRLPASHTPRALTAGPGGIWYVNDFLNTIGRIRVGGTPGDFDRDGKADIVTGPGAGGGPHVKVLSGVDGHEVLSFFAYDPAFTGGVRVAACDFNGDGVADVVTGAGVGGGPHIRVFDGTTGAQLPGPIGSFFAYDPALTSGAFVACGDVNGDGVPDVITGAGPGGGPHVRAFSGVDASEIVGVFAYAPAFTGGVFVGP